MRKISLLFIISLLMSSSAYAIATTPGGHLPPCATQGKFRCM